MHEYSLLLTGQPRAAAAALLLLPPPRDRPPDRPRRQLEVQRQHFEAQLEAATRAHAAVAAELEVPAELVLSPSRGRRLFTAQRRE